MALFNGYLASKAMFNIHRPNGELLGRPQLRCGVGHGIGMQRQAQQSGWLPLKAEMKYPDI
jgi:hypothetical protein